MRQSVRAILQPDMLKYTHNLAVESSSPLKRGSDCLCRAKMAVIPINPPPPPKNENTSCLVPFNKKIKFQK